MPTKVALAVLLCLVTFGVLWASPGNQAQAGEISQEERTELLQTREAVWRAWFANDRAALEKFLPEDLIGINNGEEKWDTRTIAIEGAKRFASEGGRLLRLEFPRTEVQYYGDVAVLYSLYITETEAHGQRTVSSGRATEVFVHRNGHWLNPGWHLDSGK